MRLSAIIVATFVGLAMTDDTSASSATQTTKGYQGPSQTPAPGSQTRVGCFKSQGRLEDPGNYTETSVSSGLCGVSLCVKQNYLVFAMKGTKCYCGNTYPPEDSLVSDSTCNYPCPAYPSEACGSISNGGAWSVFNSGIEIDVSYDDDTSSSSTASGSPSTAGSSSTSAVVSSTAATSSSATANDGKKSSNVGSIAGGVVGGVFGVGAVAAGVFLFMRRRRNREIEEEHRRNAAVNAFMNGKSSPGGSMSISDSRLDPVMAERRMSNGSIADNEDYSRRILRVTNA